MAKENLYRMHFTYWAPGGGDDGYGNVTYAKPIIFKGHWVDKDQTFLSPRGETIVSRATVYYEQNQNTIVADGWVFKGITDEPNPHNVKGAIIIRKTSEIPDIRNLEVVKCALV